MFKAAFFYEAHSFSLEGGGLNYLLQSCLCMSLDKVKAQSGVFQKYIRQLGKSVMPWNSLKVRQIEYLMVMAETGIRRSLCVRKGKCRKHQKEEPNARSVHWPKIAYWYH